MDLTFLYSPPIVQFAITLSLQSFLGITSVEQSLIPVGFLDSTEPGGALRETRSWVAPIFTFLFPGFFGDRDWFPTGHLGVYLLKISVTSASSMLGSKVSDRCIVASSSIQVELVPHEGVEEVIVVMSDSTRLAQKFVNLLESLWISKQASSAPRQFILAWVKTVALSNLIAVFERGG